MSDKEFDLMVLESLWDSELSSKKSVKPFFDGLSEVCGIKYVYHTVYDDDDMYYFIKKSKSLCSNYYIATHGSRTCLNTINNKIIDRETVHDIFKNLGGKDIGIFFGSCNFINEETAKEMLDSTKACWVAGYNKKVDWFDSTVIDLAFWRYYLKGDEDIENTQWEVAKLIYQNYPLSISLKFSLFDYEGRKVHNSLKEFKDDNEDLIKLLKK